MNGINKNELFSQKEEDNFPMKLNICFMISNLSNNHNLKLLSNYNEILKILDSNKKGKIYFFYFNRNHIHNILFEEEEVIKIKINENNRNLSYYFYLSLLINDNKDIINYSYSIDFINDIIDNYQNNLEDNLKFKKLIISKILLQIIDNYKNTNNYNEKDENYLKDIEKKNEEIINNNINYLKEINESINEKYIKQENIDIIYIDIIISLLKQNKFKDYEYISNIFNQLELEKIIITEKMIDKLSSVLDIKNSYINEYIIKNIDDLYNNDDIINFYFILFKYLIKDNIYIFQFPLLIKMRKKICKNVKDFSFLPNLKYIMKNKINYILERIIDSKYYFNRINMNENDSNHINSSSIITKSETNSKDNSTFNNNSITEHSNEAEQKNENDNKCPTPEQNKIYIKTKNEENSIPVKTNQNMNLNDSSQKQSSSIIKVSNIKAIYNNYYTDNESNSKVIKQKNENKYSILKNKRIIKELRNPLELVKKVNDSILIICEYNNKIHFVDYDYNKYFETNDYVNNIEEIKEFYNNTNLIVLSSKNLIMYLKSSQKEFHKYLLDNEKFEFNYLFKITDKIFILIAKDYVYYINHIFNRIVKNETRIIIEGVFKSGIKVNDNLFVISSNRLLDRGEDKIIFYKMNEDAICQIIEGYSFILSHTGLCVASFNNDKNKILLCACKKYIKGQKNGILIVNVKSIENDNFNKENDIIFKNTIDFEVYCFCQISFVNKFIIDIDMIKTNYILVGGYNVSKSKGYIKLVKINKHKKKFGIEIQNINIGKENFKGPISSIIQKGNNIIITCWDGKLYSFNLNINAIENCEKIK